MAPRLIVRLPNWLGDPVMALPAVRALQDRWPDARILLAGPWAHILAGQGLAEVIVSYPRAWRGRIATADAVRAFHGELAVVLPNSFEAALMARYAGAPRRVGFAHGGRAWLLTDRVPAPPPGTHQIDAYVRLVEHLGIAPAASVPVLRPPEPGSDERERARRLLDAVAGGAERPRVGVHVGAEYGAAKLWPVPRVISGCRALVADGMTPVLMGAPRDAAVAETVVRASGVASLVGRDEPALLPALLTELDALIAGDTGVAHLAAALGTPVVTLFGPTDPRLSAPRGPVTVLTHPVPCAPCFYRTCPIEHPCLDGIPAARVADAVSARLAMAS